MGTTATTATTGTTGTTASTGTLQLHSGYYRHTTGITVISRDIIVRSYTKFYPIPAPFYFTILSHVSRSLE